MREWMVYNSWKYLFRQKGMYSRGISGGGRHSVAKKLFVPLARWWLYIYFELFQCIYCQLFLIAHKGKMSTLLDCFLFNFYLKCVVLIAVYSPYALWDNQLYYIAVHNNSWIYWWMAENGTECQAVAMMMLLTACRLSIGQALSRTDMVSIKDRVK